MFDVLPGFRSPMLVPWDKIKGPIFLRANPVMDLLKNCSQIPALEYREITVFSLPSARAK